MAKQKTHDELYPDTVGKFRDLMPSGTKFTLRVGTSFTDYTQGVFLDLIQSGEHLYVAAQVAGVPHATVGQWLNKGRKSEDPTDAYYKFFQKYKHCRLTGLKLLRDKQRRRREHPQVEGDEPVTNTYNPLPVSLFTQEAQEGILDYLRKGTFPGVAAEACRIPAPVFLYWLEEGRREMQQQRDDGPFLQFYLDCMQVGAQARATAEMDVFTSMPLAWLLSGPARDKPDSPGWTKQSQITGNSGGPVQIETSWKVAQQPQQPQQQLAIEGSVREITAPAQDLTDDDV